MTYTETIDFLFSQLPMFQRIGQKAFKKDLTNTRALMELLGHPERKINAIHVAGTNGKGSVSHILAAIFQAHGFKVGLYTSPHYKDFRERIKVNGQMISKRSVSTFVKKYRDEWAIIKPSFFEITVAMAFHYFKKQKVDIAIVETGLGGRLDSTNVLNPMLSVITNIGFDHVDMLGDTIPLIAAEKAGIIKKNVPVVIGKYDRDSGPVFQQKAKEENAEISFACKSKEGRTFVKKSIQTDVNGPFQAENRRTAWVAFKTFQVHYPAWELDDHIAVLAYQAVRESTYYIGRWHWISQSPRILVDSAHNEDGLKKVGETLRKMKYRKLHLVLGFVNGKDVKKMLSYFPKDANYYFSRPDVPRGMDSNEISEVASDLNLSFELFSSMMVGLKAAKKVAEEDDLIFVGGSSFVTAEVI